MKKTTRKYLCILLANILLVGFVAVLWQTSLQASTSLPPLETPEIQEKMAAKAPAKISPVQNGTFKFVKLVDKPYRLKPAIYLKGLKDKGKLPDDILGHWTILNLWATWCAPCVTELPGLQMLHLAFENQGLKVMGISVDEAENADDLKESIARAGLSKIAIAQNWDDVGDVSNTIWPEALPLTLIVNPDGYVVAKLEGDADWMSMDAQNFVQSLLKPSASAQAQP
ncbi:MAG: TlpA family protein disulfide reductase [Alphaproteobacteria bacterium]|nr:TlpA family protein disulfide reductase [Alphaproteobacteria bacterium]